MPKWFHTSLWTVILLLTGCLALDLGQSETEKTHLRKDLSILQEAKYGLFNVDQWKREVSDVLAAKLESFDLNETNREELQKEIELLLRTIVEDAEQHYYKDHSTSILGVLQNATSNILGVFDHLKKEIPSATTIIIDFLDDPNNREEVRQYLMNELDEYSSETFGKTNYDAVDEVFQRHGIEPLERRIRMTKGATVIEARLQEISKNQEPINIASIAVFLLTAAALLLWCKNHVHIKLATACICIWFLCGLSMPILLIQAKIDSLEFFLLGEPIAFSEQVLYFQSKSIATIVQVLMLEGKEASAIVAGLGVMLFSIIIPLMKLIATAAWKENVSWANRFTGKLILFRSAKWAMADVLVVAIFLSYLGFNGIMANQLERLEQISPQMEILTTNDSKLLPGFMAFFGFAILGLLLSEKLKKLDDASRQTRGRQ